MQKEGDREGIWRRNTTREKKNVFEDVVVLNCCIFLQMLWLQTPSCLAKELIQNDEEKRTEGLKAPEINMYSKCVPLCNHSPFTALLTGWRQSVVMEELEYVKTLQCFEIQQGCRHVGM